MCFVDIFFFYIGNVSEFVLLMELEKIQIEDQIDWVIKTQVINGFQIYFSFLNRDMFFYVNFTVHNKLNLSYEDLKTWKQPRHWYIYIFFFFERCVLWISGAKKSPFSTKSTQYAHPGETELIVVGQESDTERWKPQSDQHKLEFFCGESSMVSGDSSPSTIACWFRVCFFTNTGS